jgi:hypothetical protein
MLQRTLAGGLAAGLSGCVSTKHSAPAPRSRRAIQNENRLPGTTDWVLKNTRIDPSTKYRCPWIEGYCSHTSIAAGQTLQIFVSTNPPSPFTLEIYRLGFYGGAGGRWMKSFGPIAGRMQPDPPIGPNRVRDCEWEPSVGFTIPRDWLSGVYVGKLTELRGEIQSYIIFIVRDDRQADLLFQCSDHTWQAYNRWPDQFSLYDDGEHQWYWGGDIQISFNRPYGKYCQILDAPLSIGSGEFFLWEFPFAFWLEQHGYDVTYISNTDTHARPETLRRARAFLSVGHDEYWTLEMFRQVEAAIQAGLSAGFFSGNSVCGKILLSPDGRGVPHRNFERIGVFGPPGGTVEFQAMKSLPHERPYANELMGAHSTGPVTGGADWVCVQPNHWIFAQTGMRMGEGIPGLVGWEWHGDPAPIPGLEVVASAPTQSAPGKLNGGLFTATVHPGPRDNLVFNASTCWWGDSLSEPPGYIRPSVYTTPLGPDPRAQQITRNILERMLGH